MENMISSAGGRQNVGMYFRSSHEQTTALKNVELVKSCQAGERNALEELLRRYRKSIFCWALQLTRNRESAEDVAATACLRICKGIGSFRQSSALSAWIKKIVLNVWADTNRQALRRREVSLDYLESVDADDRMVGHHQIGLEPQRRVEANDTKRILSGAISSLPTTQRVIVLLYYIEERSYEEIGELLGIPIGTVKSRMSRGRSALRGLLASQMPALMG